MQAKKKKKINTEIRDIDFYFNRSFSLYSFLFQKKKVVSELKDFQNLIAP